MGGIVDYIMTLGRGATPQVGERLMSTSSLSADAEDDSTDVAGTGTGTNAAAVSNSMFGTIQRFHSSDDADGNDLRIGSEGMRRRAKASCATSISFSSVFPEMLYRHELDRQPA